MFRSICFTLAVSLAAPAFAADTQRLAEACNEGTNLGEKICQCVAESAAEDLTADGFTFLTAMLEKDDATTARLRGEMPLADVMKASMYMVNAPKNCARKHPEKE